MCDFLYGLEPVVIQRKKSNSEPYDNTFNRDLKKNFQYHLKKGNSIKSAERLIKTRVAILQKWNLFVRIFSEGMCSKT